MHMSKASKQNNRMQQEARFYELLGVRAFRKTLLMLENIKHHKDGKKNLNYHLRNSSVFSMEGYKGYILYNTCLHVISICFVVAYFLITMLAGKQYTILTIIMCIVLAINCYCLMLQRYVFLKIQLHLAKRKNGLARRETLYIQKIITKLQEQDVSDLLCEYKEICRIKESINVGTDCLIDEQNAVILTKVGSIFQELHIRKQNINCPFCDKQIAQIIDSFSKKPKVITNIERRVSKLQKLFKMNDSSNVLYGYAIITSSGSSEEAYRILFPNGTREEIECILNAAIKAYKHVLDIEKRSTAS